MAMKKLSNEVNVDEDEGLLALRHYELEAYAATVTALRAEGGFTADKKNVLKQLQAIFGISVERHKAEIRRAVNDEKLSSIATQIHGNGCELDWQIEGQRLFGVLNRPTPITAYTKLADEIACNMLKENEGISVPDDEAKKKDEPLTINPPENPQNKLYNHVFEEVNKLIDCASDAAEELKSNNDENVGLSIADDNSDSYVYLPSGTIVQLESKIEKPSTAVMTTDSDLSSVLPKKRRRTSSSNQDQDSAFSIKQVYRPGEVQTPKEQTLPQQESLFSPKRFKSSKRNHSLPITVSLSDSQPLESRLSYEKPLDMFQSSATQKQKTVVQKYEKPSIPHTPVPPEHLYAAGSTNKSFHSRSHTSWATKHNVTNESRSKRRLQRPSPPMTSRKLSKSMPGSTRYNFSPSDKKARILSGKDTSSFQYHGGLAEQTPLRSRKSNPASRMKSFSPLSSSNHHPFQDNGLFLQASEQQQSALSPQRVFRPTLHISSSNVTKKNPALMSSDSAVVKKHSLSYPDSPMLSSSPNLLHCSVESGLAPVSTIVSQVAAQAELSSSNQQSSTEQKSRLFSAIGKVKIVRSTCPKLPMQQVKSLTSMGTQRASDTNLTAYSDPRLRYGHQPDTLNIPPPLGPLRPSYDPTKEAKRIIQPMEPISPLIQPRSNVIQPPYIKSFKEKEKQSSGSQLLRSEQNVSMKTTTSSHAIDSQSSSKDRILSPVSDLSDTITAAASGLCALASSPVISSVAGPAIAVPTLKPSPVQISNASIIKVTPRPFSVSKSLPIVTRIAGTTRITKTLTSVCGATKPSIIVVHRQQGKKSITTAPAKFLEIEGPGKPGSRVKTVTCATRPPNKLPTTIIKPSGAKLVDTSATSRPMSIDTTPISTGFHKVITKGKMRQLVLKPTSPSQSSQVLHSHMQDLTTPGIYHTNPPTKFPLVKESLSNLSLDSFQDKPNAATPLHATSTIKALMAIQKSAPSTPISSHSILSAAHGYPRAAESATESTFSHIVASKSQLISPTSSPSLKDPIVKRQQQRTAVISSKKLAGTANPNPDQGRHRSIGDD